MNSFENAVAYPPNQVFIGNLDLDELAALPSPWYQNGVAGASRNGPFGEIMPEDEFLGVMKICDDFGLLLIEKEFLANIKAKLGSHPLITADDLKKLENKGASLADIEKAVKDEGALPLFIDGDRFIGC